MTGSSLFTHLDDDLLTSLVSFFSFPTLCRLRSTCHTADSIIAREMEFRYSKVLQEFGFVPDVFRCILRRTGSVISGSVAVSVVGEKRIRPGDLDLYTSSESLPELVNGLEQHRYRIVREDSFPDDYQGGILRVVRLSSGLKVVDVVVSCTDSPILPIAFFWSTPVMTFLGADGVCNPYPIWFEHGRGLLNPGRMPMEEAVQDSLVRKYSDRGFDIRATEEDWPTSRRINTHCRRGMSATCPKTMQYISDRFTLRTGIGVVAARRTGKAFVGTLVTLTTVWWRGGAGCGGGCNEGRTTEFAAWTQEVEMVGL